LKVCCHCHDALLSSFQKNVDYLFLFRTTLLCSSQDVDFRVLF
jgi:hypothetical protein